MRAVNLLPTELRGVTPKPAVRVAREPVQGIGAYVVLGVLALCVAAFAGHVLLGNQVEQRTADLAAATARTQVATTRAAALKPYADFEALANARVETVRGLAAARFDWEQSLRDLSRALPADVKLSALSGDMGTAGGAGGGGAGDPLRASIAAPALSLAGCAASQRGVARMLSRLKGVEGVTRVSLSKSEKPGEAAAPAATDASPCRIGAPTFSAVVFFERSAAAAAMAVTGADAGASAPVPSAIAEADKAAPGDDAAGGDAPADADPAASTAPPTESAP